MRQEADEPAEGAPQVILLEDDAAQRDLLLELFADEGITVEVCATLAEIRAALRRHPRSIVVADSWAAGDHEDLGEQQRSEIDALSRQAPLILTTGREWGRQLKPDSWATSLSPSRMTWTTSSSAFDASTPAGPTSQGNACVALGDSPAAARRSSERTGPWLPSTER